MLYFSLSFTSNEMLQVNFDYWTNMMLEFFMKTQIIMLC